LCGFIPTINSRLAAAAVVFHFVEMRDAADIQTMLRELLEQQASLAAAIARIEHKLAERDEKPPGRDWFCVKEAADAAGISESQMTRWCHALGEPFARFVPPIWMISKTGLAEQIEARARRKLQKTQNGSHDGNRGAA